MNTTCLLLLLQTYALTAAGAGLNLSKEISFGADLENENQQVVNAVAISSIESRIAVCVTRTDGTHLIVIDDTVERNFDTRVDSTQSACSDRLHWSPDGRSLVTEAAGGVKVWDFSSGTSCTIPRRDEFNRPMLLGFVDDERFSVAFGIDQGLVKGSARNTRLSLFDRGCDETRSWTVMGRVSGGVTSSFSGAVAMNRSLDPYLYLDTKTGAQREGKNLFRVSFADYGKIVCLVGGPRGKTDIGCLVDVDAATETHQFGMRSVSGYSTAERAPFIALTEWYYSRNPFTEREWFSPKQWIIWDIRSQRIVGKLRASEQTGQPASVLIKSAFASALSPSGRRFVIAGNRTLRIYEVTVK